MKEEHVMLSVILGAIIGIFAALFWVVHKGDEQDKVRRAEVSNFYHANNCKPHGYVGTRREVVRTYICNGEVYITADMK